MTWHRFIVPCKKCGEPMMFFEVHFSVDNQIMGIVYCLKCDKGGVTVQDIPMVLAECRRLETPDIILFPGNETVN